MKLRLDDDHLAAIIGVLMVLAILSAAFVFGLGVFRAW